MNENFESMSVLQLRQAAKEMGVKLGAGINKQGIIEKLAQAAAKAHPAFPEDAHRPYSAGSAAIITDDPMEDDEDVPVLTASRPAPPAPRPAPRPAAPASTPGASSLSTISAKAPAFTMEGSRAWHNPRAYQPQGGNYPRSQNWGARASQPGADSHSYARPAQQRPDNRNTAYPQRFGPGQTSEDQHAPADYHAPDHAPQQEHYQDYVPPREGPSQHAYSRPAPASSLTEILAAGDCGDGAGILEVLPDGYGFLRSNHFLSGKNDVYISNAQVRRFSLRSGDLIAGKTRPQRESDRYCAMLYITEINGHPAEETDKRSHFDDLTPVYPQKKMALSGRGQNDPLLRTVDLLCPIGFGQRALIAAPPQADRAALLRQLGLAIAKNHPKAHLLLLLVDEKPEEVTAIREGLPMAEAAYSTLDETPESHARAAELALERAMRLVEQKKDVVILMDSLTRLARACNATAPASVRALPDGLAATALNKPKRLFGAARCAREGGSLTVIATALQDTGDPIDQAILNGLKEGANMVLSLNGDWMAKGLSPAVDIQHSATCHGDLLLSPQEADVSQKIRRMMAGLEGAEGLGQLLSMLEKTSGNEDLVQKFDAWMSL